MSAILAMITIIFSLPLAVTHKYVDDFPNQCIILMNSLSSLDYFKFIALGKRASVYTGSCVCVSLFLTVSAVVCRGERVTVTGIRSLSYFSIYATSVFYKKP